MNRMTFNLIMVAKNAQFGEAEKFVKGSTSIERIKSYISHVTSTPEEDISAMDLRNIFMEAISDYIDTCDSPSVVIRQLETYGALRTARFESTYKAIDVNNVYDAYASVLMMIQIKCIDLKGKTHYINGFREEFFKEWKDEYEW